MLSKEKLEHYKKRLEQMKKDAEEELEMDDESYKTKYEFPDDSLGEFTNYDNHPADLGTELYERSRAQTFKEQARERIEEIERALRKIENGTYGLSEHSGKPIPEDRLDLVPYARYRVDEVDDERKIGGNNPRLK